MCAAAVIVGILACPNARADDVPIDDDEILESPDDFALRVTSATLRLTAYDQYGHGYQSKAGPHLGPGDERLTVFEPQLEIRAKQGPKLTHRLWIPVDVITAASPDAIDRDRLNKDGKPDVVSSASRRNEAGTVELTSTYRAPASVDVSLQNGIHLEEEYRSWHGGLVVSKGFEDETTTASIGVLGAFDWFDRFDVDGRRQGRTRRSTHTLTLGVTQILTPSTVFEASYGLTVQTGTLGNTWNAVPLEDGSIAQELLPDRRTRHAFVGRFVQALPWNAAIKGYYRYYTDTWSIDAHSVEAQWLQRISPIAYVGTGFRHHLQTSASFFTTRAALTAVRRTADSDLARLDSDSLTFRMSFDVPLAAPGPRALHLDVAFERYWRSNDLDVNVLTCSSGFSF